MMSEDFGSSRLGTKQHWDDVYEAEVKNFNDFGDEGEIWFGEDKLEKMIDWCVDNISPDTHPHCLDVGTGNGSMLFALVDADYDPHCLLGIDYSPASIQLCHDIAATKSTPHDRISFQTLDFIRSPPPSLPHAGSNAGINSWDLVLDKGTFDAIALADEKLENGRPLIDGYASKVHEALKSGGFFLITSCNFTEEELKRRFTAEPGMVYHSRVKYPSFTFGGQTGSTVSTIAFRKA